MEGGISQKEKYRYVAHLMFFIGCALFSFGIWARQEGPGSRQLDFLKC